MIKTRTLTVQLTDAEVKLLNGMFLFAATVYKQYPELAHEQTMDAFRTLISKYEAAYHKTGICNDKRCQKKRVKGGDTV